jgi:agmatinase
MSASTTFLGLPSVLAEGVSPRAVIFSAGHGTTYADKDSSGYALAPEAIRAASQRGAPFLDPWDFDLDGPLFAGKPVSCVDVGDVATVMHDNAENRARIEARTREIVAAGAVPILLGGDDSVPIPMLAGFEGRGPLTILQIDAHVDWADVIQGNPYGYGSTMRRCAEYSWVDRIVQVGIRGLGSGESWQHDDARAWGAQLVTSYALHEQGPGAVLDLIEPGARVVVSLDCDGINPAVLPAVNMPTPGGLTYEDMVRLLRGVAAKATLAGLALVEYVPSRDTRWLGSGLVAARIAAVTAALAREAVA